MVCDVDCLTIIIVTLLVSFQNALKLANDIVQTEFADIDARFSKRIRTLLNDILNKVRLIMLIRCQGSSLRHHGIDCRVSFCQSAHSCFHVVAGH